jgi:xanthine dehydrogenase small subunit
VVLAEPAGDGLRYRAINACITPLAALHGRQLLSVEHLAEGAVLHPVQQAMVDCHGAQCGFCTPGIVMSLFAWRHAEGAHDRDTALSALSGNLCRCTATGRSSMPPRASLRNQRRSLRRRGARTAARLRDRPPNGA